MDDIKEITLPSGALLRFLEEPHEYELWTESAVEPDLLDGIHSVMVQNKITKPLEEWARPYVERGSRVHKATERYDLGLPIDPAWLASDEARYLEDWKKFLAEHPEFSVTDRGLVESLVGSEEAGMASVVDRQYREPKILQVKTGEPNAKVHAVQMAFEGLMALMSASHFQCFAVYLKGDGDPKLREYDVFNDGSLAVAQDIMRARMTTRKYMSKRRKPVKVTT